MKTIKSYILGLAAALGLTSGFTACQDDFDNPNVEAPVATLQANTTIAELKAAFWQDATNYADTVRLKEDGSHYIIKGRVISSDEESNVFKNISIQDETGAITFSVNSYNLYLKYRRGQEIVIDATGMYIGKYAGLQQFGMPSYYENGATWQVGFMSPQFFEQHIELNGNPDVAKLDTITVNSVSAFDTSAEGLRKWQSQLVRINNVHFQDAGVKTFSEYHSSANDDVNKTLIDSEGNNIIVRTSGYATFWNKILPEGDGDIVGILSFYQNLSGSSMWQLILNDYEGCMNFGNPTVAPGTENNPYTVEQVIKLEADGTPSSGWVSGYIVGSVKPGVTEVTSNDDIEWSADDQMAYTLVIGSDKETKDFASALVIELPANSPLKQLGNLRDNPANLGKAISLRGTFAKVMGTYGVADNSGAASQFKIEGLENGGGAVENGSGTKESPYSPNQIIALNPTSTTAAVETGIWVKGYIVGYMPTDGSSTTLSGTVFGVSGNVANTNLVIAATPDETNPSNCIGIQLPAGSVAPGLRDALNLQANPGNLGKLLSINGDVMKYCGGPGVKNATEWSLEGAGTTPDVTPSNPETATGSGTETDPYNCAKIISLNPTSTTAAVETGIWATGYIVGYMPTGGSSTVLSGTVFGVTGEVATTNLVIAGAPDVTDPSKCVGIQLPAASVAPGLRDALNLQANPGNLGKLLLINGDVMKYCGGPGIKNATKWSLDGAGSTVTPPATSNSIYSESFTDGSLGQFTTSVQTSGSWTGWRANTGTVACAIANSYTNSVNEAATAWMLSPDINLTGATNASISVEQAFGFYFPTAQESFCTVNIRENGGEWKQLTLTAFPEKGTGNWTGFVQNTIDISAYVGKTVQIGFKYYNDGKQSVAWEIRNFAVNADAGSTAGGGNSDPGTGGDRPGTETPGGDTPSGSDSATGTGTETDPYNCAKVIELNPTSKDTAVEKGVWVEGYIIGYMPSNNTKPAQTITTAEGCEVQTNLVLAPTPTEKDFTKCLPIQLPTEAKAPGIRSSLNLKDNPANLGKKVLLKGDVILYCGAPGIKETSAYKFID